MDNIEMDDRISQLLFRMKCAVGLLDVIYESMNSDRYTTDMFAPVIFIAYEYISNIERSLSQWKEDEFSAN